MVVVTIAVGMIVSTTIAPSNALAHFKSKHHYPHFHPALALLIKDRNSNNKS